VTGAQLRQLLATELEQPAPPAALALAAELARRGGAATSAVLYYGSALRAGELTGILDFYVLLDEVGAWPAPWLARLGNRLLPPNVGYLEMAHEGQVVRAKFAVLSRTQFARRLRTTAIDTTIWARFSQPALLAWSRSAADRHAAIELVADAVACAASWAARLGPRSGRPEEFWRALFARTYAAELRVEKQARAQDIVGKAPGRYAAMLPLAWDRTGIRYLRDGDGMLTTEIPQAERDSAAGSWAWRQRLGRPLNILRLLKAAFTFEGAMDYAAWKIERHSGVHIEVTPWQRRFPLLAAPGLYLKLRREGVLRGGGAGRGP
jgi:hypothetical protein